MAMAIAARLMSVQRLENNWHGVVAQESNESGHGLVISGVEKESPAADSGLKAGDVITAVGSQEVSRPLDLERAMLGRKSGEKIEVAVKRHEQSVNVTLVLASLPHHSPAVESDPVWDVIGFRLTPMPAAQFKQFQSRYRGGLTVTAVRPDSPAAKQGIRRGDVLVGMHVWETVSMDNVTYILNRPELGRARPHQVLHLAGQRNAVRSHGAEW